MVTSYFDPATKLIYAAGALCGLIGAIRVYSKFSSDGWTDMPLRSDGSSYTEVTSEVRCP